MNRNPMQASAGLQKSEHSLLPQNDTATKCQGLDDDASRFRNMLGRLDRIAGPTPQAQHKGGSEKFLRVRWHALATVS